MGVASDEASRRSDATLAKRASGFALPVAAREFEPLSGRVNGTRQSRAVEDSARLGFGSALVEWLELARIESDKAEADCWESWLVVVCSLLRCSTGCTRTTQRRAVATAPKWLRAAPIGSRAHATRLDIRLRPRRLLRSPLEFAPNSAGLRNSICAPVGAVASAGNGQLSCHQADNYPLGSSVLIRVPTIGLNKQFESPNSNSSSSSNRCNASSSH